MSVQELSEAQEEHKQVVQVAREEATKEAGTKLNAAGNNKEASSGAAASIKTVEGRGKSASNGNSTSYAATNSASYGAHQNSQYQQYGSRYNSYGGGSYGGAGGYYQGYGSGGYYGSR